MTTKKKVIQPISWGKGASVKVSDALAAIHVEMIAHISDLNEGKRKEFTLNEVTQILRKYAYSVASVAYQLSPGDFGNPEILFEACKEYGLMYEPEVKL